MRSYGQYCSVAKALDVVGDRWTFLIVRELLLRGACRYTDLRAGLPGIATNLLADRLRELESAGLVQREEAPPPVATTLFQLTGAGLELEPVLQAIGQWGMRFMARPAQGDEFRGHWFTFPVSYFLRDRDPGAPPATIELRAASDPVVIEVSGGSVRTRLGSAAAPDLVLAGEPRLIMALLSGHRSAAEAKDLGLEVSGDDTVLRRVLPDSPAFAIHSPDPHLPNGSRPSPTRAPCRAGCSLDSLSVQEGARRMTASTDNGSLVTFPGRDGQELAYRSTGEGRPLVLLHGFTGNGQHLLRSGLPAALARPGYRVIVPDLRGHGDSARPHDPAAYPPDVLADDGLALVDFLQLSDYDLGGYSAGAKVVLRMLARGARPARAIIAGQGLDALDGSTSRTGGYRRMLAAIASGDRLEPGSPLAMQADWLAQSGADPRALLYVLDSFVDTPVTALAAITTPTLVVAGEEDERQAEKLAAALPAARYVPVPGNHATAMVSAELAAAIVAFLGEDATRAPR